VPCKLDEIKINRINGRNEIESQICENSKRCMSKEYIHSDIALKSALDILKKPMLEQFKIENKRPTSPPFFHDNNQQSIIKIQNDPVIDKCREKKKIKVLYDEKLKCYYDPESNQYYEA